MVIGTWHAVACRPRAQLTASCLSRQLSPRTGVAVSRWPYLSHVHLIDPIMEPSYCARAVMGQPNRSSKPVTHWIGVNGRDADGHDESTALMAAPSDWPDISRNDIRLECIYRVERHHLEAVLDDPGAFPGLGELTLNVRLVTVAEVLHRPVLEHGADELVVGQFCVDGGVVSRIPAAKEDGRPVATTGVARRPANRPRPSVSESNAPTPMTGAAMVSAQPRVVIPDGVFRSRSIGKTWHTMPM